MANVKVVNFGQTAQRIEFINRQGDHDSATVLSRQQISIDEDTILTPAADLTKKGLKILKDGPVVAKVETSAPAASPAASTFYGNKKSKTSGSQDVPNTSSTDVQQDNI
jgi:hypothetical protein